ncbi:sigma-70 family RNA polymerase sigma factor [Roseiarcaceae bacterium H3SJ34-1]|uniref:RNA polymerase sigma factor n=1 Tax=Terripilifer ovatus TaxID=3032367 RepID=UPI003AB9AE55|nr:sigma-70 family RNA polymerase sigma factor [Roseiarcaceae bacterium H3SJ34-1]
MAGTRPDLILRVQAGDTAALGQLLAECQADARRYAMRHCVTSEIDDAVQEALLVVTRHVSSLKAVASFAGWLFTIVRRECSKLSRKMFSHEDVEDDRVQAQLAALSMVELRTELASALESLPPHYLEIILMRDFEELTISEICAQLDISVATAKARLRRARLLVREYLVGSDEEGRP